MNRSFIALALTLTACKGDDAVQPDAPPPPIDAAGNIELVNLPIGGPVPVDVLLVIDNSGSMQRYQNQVGAAIHRLTDALGAGGVLPDLHLGVVTSDLGTLGVAIGDAACSDSDDGRLQTSGCAGIAAADTFLTDVLDPATGNRTRNYTGTLAAAAACMVNVGNTGCGFEQHLEAMRIALGQPGFVRAEADLVIVIVADEDDCSAYNPAFYGPESPELGPMDSFRCFEQGVRCNPDDPRAEGTKSQCGSREDSAYLHPITRYEDFFHSLKPDTTRIAYGLIVGDDDPVIVGRRTPSGTTMPRPDLIESCTFDLPAGAGTLTADPAVRLSGLASIGDFGHILEASACAADYPVLTEIGAVAHDTAVGHACFASGVVDHEAGGDIQGECFLTLNVPGSAPAPLAVCDAGDGNPPCWRIAVDATVCPDGEHNQLVVVTGPQPQGTRVAGNCNVH